jgi:uncharacterized protein (TIGR03437 family)
MQLDARTRVFNRMRICRASAVLSAVGLTLLAQVPPTNPVVEPRGVLNAFTRQPAPTVVAPGGLIVITGLNLGPAMGAKAEGPTWPTRLADVEVMINARQATIASVEPGRIVVQVPWEIPNGLAQVVVRRGQAASRPARFLVNAIAPSAKTADDSGFGILANAGTANSVKMTVNGLGLTDPRLPNGELGEATPRNEVRVFVGGMPVAAAVTSSKELPGAFDVAFDAPAGAVPGDLITVTTSGRSANRGTLSQLSVPEVMFVKFAEGTPEIRGIQSADLRGTLVAAASSRNDQGCYQAFVFDLSAGKSSTLDDCVTTAQRQNPLPFTFLPEGSSIAALVGPPQADPPNPISSKVKIVSAGKSEPMTVDLPAAATGLATTATGNFIAVHGQGSLTEIDADTGSTRELTQAAGGGGGNALNANNLRVDLGDGLNQVLTQPVQVQQGMFAVIVGDDDEKPTRAKLAAINAQGQVQQSMDFPSGWVPLVPPTAQVPAGVQLPVNALRLRVSSQYDAATRSMFVLSRRTDLSHGVVTFSFDETPVRAVELPEGWYAATCSANIPFLQLELARRIAFFADRTDAGQARTPCPAQGFAVFDIPQRTLEVVPVPGVGHMNAAGGANEINDFVYATNIDASRNNRADTIFTLDGVTLTPARFDPPPGVAAIGQVVRAPELNLLIAPGTNRAQGDGGFVVFDLDRAETRVMPSPEGFTSVQFLGILTSTRKLVARGIRPDGARLLVYDLVTGDLFMPANPEGVAWFGPPVQAGAPGQPGQGPGQGPGPGPGIPLPGQGQQQQQQTPLIGLRANVRANTVEAIGYNTERQQVGIVVVRVP